MPRAKLKYASGLPVANHGLHLLPIYHPSYILRLRGGKSDAEVEHQWKQDIAAFSLMVRGAMDIDHAWAEHHSCLYCNKMRQEGKYTCKTHTNTFRLDHVWKEAHIQETML